MGTPLPTIADLTTKPSTHLAMRNNFAAIRNYLSGLLGEDGEVATALASLGVLAGSFVAKTAAYTVLLADRGKIIDASGTWTLSLPSVASAGAAFSLILRNSGSGTITVDPAGAEQVDGVTTVAVTPGRSVVLFCNGTAWSTIWMVTGAATLTGAETLTNKTITISDTQFTLQDNGDPTKQAQFDLAGISTGTTRTYALPNVNSTLLGDVAVTTNIGNAPNSTAVNIAAAATTTGLTKTVNIGTGGAAGSSAIITIGSIQGGSIIFQSPTISFADAVTSFVIGDTVFTLADNADSTKKLKFELSGITTGTTRTLTVPNANGTLALDTVFGSAAKGLVPASGGGTTNFLRADGSWAAPAGGGGGITDGDKGDVVVSGSGTVWSLDYTAVNASIAPVFANVTSKPTTLAGYGITDAVDLGSSQTISGNKTFSGTVSFSGAQTIVDSGLTLQDDVDPTKQGTFQLSGLTSGASRIWSLPDVTGVLVSASQVSPTLFNTTANQTVNIANGVTVSGNTKTLNIGTGGASGSTTNINLGSSNTGALGTLFINSAYVTVTASVTSFTIRDSQLVLTDDADATKKMQFQLSGITTATTRTVTMPDASGTLVLDAATQTLTNKTLTSPVISGGSIDNATIGATTPATITGSSLTSTSVITAGVNSHAAGTLALAFASKAVAKVTPNASGTFTTTVPPAGTRCSLIITTSGTTSYTMTFGTGFKTTGTLATGTVTAKTFVVEFISDGTTLIETNRTVAM